jgi:hypothetical protein
LPPPPGASPRCLQKRLEKPVITDLNDLETLIPNIKITIEAHRGQIMALQPIEIEILVPDRQAAPQVAMDLIEKGIEVVVAVVITILISIKTTPLLIEEEQMVGEQITMQITMVDRFDHLQEVAVAVVETNSNEIQILDFDLNQEIDLQEVVMVVVVVVVEEEGNSSVLQFGLITCQIFNKIDLYIDLVPQSPAQFLGGRRIKCKKSSRQRSRRSMRVKKCRRGRERNAGLLKSLRLLSFPTMSLF